MPRNRAKRDAKNSRSAERGCSSVLPPPNRRRMVEASNPAPPRAGYAAQSRKARCKNSRSAERGCSSVLPPPNRRRMVGARNPAPPLAGYAAQSRKARCKKQPERRARLFLCSPAAEQAANGWSPQPCPTTSRLCRAIARSAMQKTAGAPSEAVPLSSRRRTGGEWLGPATLPHH